MYYKGQILFSAEACKKGREYCRVNYQTRIKTALRNLARTLDCATNDFQRASLLFVVKCGHSKLITMNIKRQIITYSEAT